MQVAQTVTFAGEREVPRQHDSIRCRMLRGSNSILSGSGRHLILAMSFHAQDGIFTTAKHSKTGVSTCNMT